MAVQTNERANREVERLLALAFKAGAKPRPQISDRDLLADFVDIVWHGDKGVWESNPWVRRLNQVWLDDARAVTAP